MSINQDPGSREKFSAAESVLLSICLLSTTNDVQYLTVFTAEQRLASFSHRERGRRLEFWNSSGKKNTMFCETNRTREVKGIVAPSLSLAKSGIVGKSKNTVGPESLFCAKSSCLGTYAVDLRSLK
jgi:hypothetical protein